MLTQALSRTYPSYRTCRGDGNCGWRGECFAVLSCIIHGLTNTAIAFGYYDSLLRTGDPNKFVQEETRLRSLRNTCKAAGFDIDILEGFEEIALELLTDTAATLHTPDAENSLVAAFNNDEIQNYIITYFRVLPLRLVHSTPSGI